MDPRVTEDAFTAGQACRLSGVAYRTLDCWGDSGGSPAQRTGDRREGKLA